MSAPDELQDPLLGADFVNITCHGVRATLVVDAEGGISYAPLKPRPGSRACCACCGCGKCQAQHLQQQVPGCNVVGAALESPTSFRVWYYTQRSKAKAGSDAAAAAPAFKLRKTLPFVCASGTEAQALVQRVRQGASWHGRGKPLRLLAIINPSSGRGKSAKLFQKQVAPVLEDAAGMTLSRVVTQHAGHATELTRQLSLAAVDMLVFVGGDGTVFEGLQGLLSRPDWDAARLLPIAHVPGGSGNGLAHSCGLQDAATAAFCICKGVVSPMDVASVLQAPAVPGGSPRRMYSMLMATYGLMSNLDVGTEHLRWMGDTRFLLGLLWEIVKSRSYQASIAWLPAEEDRCSSTSAAACSSSSSKQPVQGAAAPPSGPPELPGSNGCAAAAAGASSAAAAGAQQGACISLQDFPPGPDLPLLSQLGGQLPLSLPRQPNPCSQPHPCLPPHWRLQQQPLQMWALFNPPFVAADFKVNPQGRLSSGHMDMMWVQGLTGLAGRLKALEVQVKAQQGGHVSEDCVTLNKVRAMVFEPRDSSTCLMLDGEVVPAAPIFLEVHQGLIRVLINPAHRVEPAADRSRQQLA